MNIGGWLKCCLVIMILLLASCTTAKLGHHRGMAGDGTSGVSSQGIRGALDFSHQEKGELYSTSAPSNQIFLFAYDNSQVAEKYLPAINAQAAYLVAHPNSAIMLAGHTDSRGSREYNIALGERRAMAVVELLKLAGVKAAQMRVVSYGEERPIAFGNSEAEYRLNRRVELTYEKTR